MWDAEKGTEIRTFVGHKDRVGFAAFSSDGKYIVSASWDRTVRIWDAKTGAEVCAFKGHTAYVYSAVFNPIGRQIVSASEDGTIRIWEFPPLQELINETRERFKDHPLTPEERKMYYLE